MAAVDIDGPGEKNLLELVEIAYRLALVEVEDGLAIRREKLHNSPDVAVESILAVAGSGLDDFVPKPEMSAESLDNRLAKPVQIEVFPEAKCSSAGSQGQRYSSGKSLDIVRRSRPGTAKFLRHPVFYLVLNRQLNRFCLLASGEKEGR